MLGKFELVVGKRPQFLTTQTSPKGRLNVCITQMSDRKEQKGWKSHRMSIIAYWLYKLTLLVMGREYVRAQRQGGKDVGGYLGG